MLEEHEHEEEHEEGVATERLVEARSDGHPAAPVPQLPVGWR